VPHRLMDCANLALDVGEKIKLKDDEHFGVLLEDLEIASSVRQVHLAEMY
jgi:hypothetical protein